MVNNNKLIGQMLISAGVVTPKELELGLAEQEKSGDFICNVLVLLNIFLISNSHFRCCQ